jgi:hypothetical protein
MVMQMTKFAIQLFAALGNEQTLDGTGYHKIR